jgi:hypothetical protein
LASASSSQLTKAREQSIAEHQQAFSYRVDPDNLATAYRELKTTAPHPDLPDAIMNKIIEDHTWSMQQLKPCDRDSLESCRLALDLDQVSITIVLSIIVYLEQLQLVCDAAHRCITLITDRWQRSSKACHWIGRKKPVLVSELL